MRPRVSFLMRYLDPTELLDEFLFALIMALSITLGVCLASDKDTSALQARLPFGFYSKVPR